MPVSGRARHIRSHCSRRKYRALAWSIKKLAVVPIAASRGETTRASTLLAKAPFDCHRIERFET